MLPQAFSCCKADAPGADAPGANQPGRNPSGRNPPGRNPPGGNAPGRNPPGRNPPGRNPPGGNAPGRNPPGGNAPGGDERRPDRKGKAKAEQKNEGEQQPVFGEKENFLNLQAECYGISRRIRKKIKQLGKQYPQFRRIQNDDGSVYQSFLFAYVEHIWETQDRTEVERIKASLKVCKWTNDIRGRPSVHFEERMETFVQLLNEHIGESRPRSHEEFLSRSRAQWPTPTIDALLDRVAGNEYARQSADVLRSPNTDRSRMYHILGEGPATPFHKQLTALADALGVPVRLVFLDMSPEQELDPQLRHRDYLPSSQPWKVPANCRATFPPDSISLEEVRYTLYASRINSAATSSASSRPDPSITLLFRRSADADYYDILYQSDSSTS